MKQFKRLQEEAYEYIRNRLLEHKLEYHVVYSETKLAEEIGISRTPVRDALQRLAQEGMIDIMPSKGFTLHHLTEHDLLETYHMRCALESYCMRLLSKQHTTPRAQALLAKMRELLDKQIEIAKTSRDFVQFADIDQQFHTVIVSFAECTQFNELLHNYMHCIYRFALDSFLQEGRMEATLVEHENMYRAAQTGDVAWACNTTISHMDALKDITLGRI